MYNKAGDAIKLGYKLFIKIDKHKIYSNLQMDGFS